ncbi:MAG TPA: DUF1614 domain-containing protein [Methylococcaceae bacterium]|nr:DUF1614 domain-containing protein [Methylococcaceae bacterium]
MFGLHPRWVRVTDETVIAINLGGRVIPAGLAAFEIARLAAYDAHSLVALGILSIANVLVCYSVARPIQAVESRCRAWCLLWSPRLGAATGLGVGAAEHVR